MSQDQPRHVPGLCAPRRRHHGNRFGRSEQARQAVMEAVDGLLLERGFAALTIEAVAAQAGVGKQTIYRWWSSKIDLLFDAFVDEMDEELERIDRGSLCDDLRAHMRQLASFFVSPGNAAMFKALAGQAQHDSAFAARFRDGIVAPLRARDRAPLAQAQARGELPADIDIDVLVEELTGPVYYRLLVSGAVFAVEDGEAAANMLVRRWSVSPPVPAAAAAPARATRSR